MVTILVVDDEEIVHRSLSRAANRAQFSAELVRATNGAEALEILENAGPENGAGGIDGILIDINMPIMDGFALLKSLRGDARFSDLPVIILSSSDNPSDIDRAGKLGANDYLVKSAASSLVAAVLRMEALLSDKSQH